MAYDPLTGRYTPDPTPTPFEAGSKDPFEALLARLGKRTDPELTKLEEIAKVATNPAKIVCRRFASSNC
jgi:hypothetical protein